MTPAFNIQALASRTVLVLFSMIFALALTTASAEEPTGTDPSTVEVVFETSLGNFILALEPLRAPATVANFLAYVDSGFYTNTLIHRIIPGFVIQGGGFEPGMRPKPTLPPVENEAGNKLINDRGAISMARTNDPDSATSQFFINLKRNVALDGRGDQPGYAVFGKVVEGMGVIDRIAAVPTLDMGPYRDVPAEDVVVRSAYRNGTATADDGSPGGVEPFQLGVHYTMLPQPVTSATPGRIEVVELFSFGCPHCYELDSYIIQWGERQSPDVAFRQLPAVWNPPMKMLAKAYYAAEALGVEKVTHTKLFEAIVIRQQKISTPGELSAFFAANGVDSAAFTAAFESDAVAKRVARAETLTRHYNPAGVPEIIVNGKYRVDRMRAGGMAQMIQIVDYLVARGRQELD